MLNIRTIIISVVLAVIFMLTVQLVTARTEVVSAPSSDSVIVLDHQDRFDKMNPSYRSPLDECFDVSLSERASCRNASQATVPSYRSPLDECFDVSLSERASCRNASQAPAP